MVPTHLFSALSSLTSSVLTSFNILQGKDSPATSERESCPEPHTGAAAGVFELAAACTTTNSDNETHNNDQGAKAIQSLSNSPLSKTSGVLGSEAKDLQSARSKGGSSTSHSTTASTAKRLATTLHARPLRCPSKLLTHKLAISHRPKTSTILGQIGKNAGPCHLAGVLSLGGGEDARVAEPSVYDLPPTQPEVATEEHMKKAASSKRKAVLTHEQVISTLCTLCTTIATYAIIHYIYIIIINY